MAKGNAAAWTMGLALMASVASWARGDGCMFAIKEVGQAQKMVASHRQEAILATDGQTVRVTLRTHFRAGPAELAWIVPVPAKPDSVEAGDDAVFADLEGITAPKFYRLDYRGSSPGFGCGAAANWEGHRALDSTVKVEASGSAGIFKYEVLSATDANDLVDWLTRHNYAVGPRATGVFSRYVKARWHWLAMRVRPEATERPELAPHPVVYTYRATELTYPLVISELSAEGQNEVLLYVLAGVRYACGNWYNLTGEQLAEPGSGFGADPNSPSGTNYEMLFRQATGNKGGRLFVTEYSRNHSAREAPLAGLLGRKPDASDCVDQVRLTRLRALVFPTEMDRDVWLVPVPGEAVRTYLRVSRAEAGAANLAGMTASGGAMGLVCSPLVLPRRRRWGRGVAGACVAAGCLVLTML